MRFLILFTLVLVVNEPIFGQCYLDFQAGPGISTSYLRSIKIAPDLEADLRKKLSYHLSIGSGFELLNISFTSKLANINSAGNFRIIGIDERTVYLFPSVFADWALGRNNQKVHLVGAFGPGLFIGGHRYINRAEPSSSHLNAPPNIYQYATTKDVNKLIVGITIKATEQFARSDVFSFSFFQQFKYIPNYLDTENDTFYLRTDYFSIGIAVTENLVPVRHQKIK